MELNMGDLIVGGMNAGTVDIERVQGKRRRFGRFIGLRGCESPVVGKGGKEGGDGREEEEEEEEVRRWVEGEMRRRMERQAEEEVWRRKFGGGMGW